MGVIVTDQAKLMLADVIKDSEFTVPALRIYFAGFG